MKRRIEFILPLGIMLIISLSFGAYAADKVKLELSSTLAPGSCIELAADKFKEMVENKSQGNIEIVRYPSGELYDPKSEIEAVAHGTLAMATLHNAYVGGRSPALEFISSFGAQGCWKDYDHYYRFIDTPRVREIAANEFKNQINAKLLAMLPYGNSLVGNVKRPIHTVEDFKGLKMRNAGTAQATMYRALGAIPIEMSSSEVYMALQRGTIDGATSGPSRFYLSKWYEVTPYLTQDYSLPYLSFWLAISNKFWDDLSPANQQLLADVALEVEAWARDYAATETNQFYEKMKASDKVKDFYFFPESEREEIRKIVAPLMKETIIKREGKDLGEELWSLMEETRTK